MVGFSESWVTRQNRVEPTLAAKKSWNETTEGLARGLDTLEFRREAKVWRLQNSINETMKTISELNDSARE